MRLEGLHHVTAITADAPRNVDFYAVVLGLRFVKKTVNYDAPDVYHLYYGDEHGDPGSIMTFFEFPDAAPGRAGAGMVHTVAWRVAGEEALDFWAARLEHAGRPVERETGVVRSSDPEGLGLGLVVSDVPDPPLTATADGVAAEYALQGFDGVRAFAPEPQRSQAAARGSASPLPTSRGRWRASSGARSTPTTRRRRPSAACRARGPCTTSPGRRVTPTSTAGARSPAPPARSRRR